MSGTPQQLLRVEKERIADGVRIALSGELDVSTARLVRAQLEGLSNGTPLGLLVLDLQGLSFMDSTGIRLLLEIDALSRSDGFRLAIVRGPRAVHRVLELTGVDARLPIVERAEDAGSTHA